MVSFRQIWLSCGGWTGGKNDSKEVTAVIKMRNSGLDQSTGWVGGREWIWEIQETDS